MCVRIIIIFLLAINVASTDDVTIEWSQSKQLTWSDFKGAVDHNSDAVAVTASGITFSFSIKEADGRYMSFDAIAKAHFYPDKSWYDDTQGNDHILAHEQLHFDITELNVRKLRYKISELKVSQKVKKQLRLLHQEANADLAKMQNDYDIQTENSMNVEAQLKWSQLIKSELDKFQEYRSK